MIIDSSAILAIIGKEPGHERIVHELAAAPGTGSAHRPGWRPAASASPWFPTAPPGCHVELTPARPAVVYAARLV